MKLELLQVTQSSQSCRYSFSASFSEGLHLLTGPDPAAADTLLRLLTGRKPPEQGQIRFLGYDIFLLDRAYQNHLAYFSRYPLFPDSFPLLHYLIYSAILQRLEPRQAKEKAMKLLKDFHLVSYAFRSLGSLPNELRKRVLLINTLWSEAPIYLLQHPLAYAAPEDMPWLCARLQAIRRSKIVLISEPKAHLLEGLSWQVCPLPAGTPLPDRL